MPEPVRLDDHSIEAVARHVAALVLGEEHRDLDPVRLLATMRKQRAAERELRNELGREQRAHAQAKRELAHLRAYSGTGRDTGTPRRDGRNR